MEPVISLRGAVSVLGRFPALAGVDLTVSGGETVLLVGPNGAGKSTLLRLCAGLVSLADGDGRVLGCDLRRDRGRLRRRVGYLGHANGLYDELTVAENVRFWARAAGVEDWAVRSEEAMDLLSVSARTRQLAAGRLSAGQRRRAALAALVVRRPELWLLDEPHAGLDGAARDELDALVRAAVAAGATVLVASHEVERGQRLCSRRVTIAGGVIVADERGPAPPVRSRETPAPREASRRPQWAAPTEHRGSGPTVWRDAALVAGKDLRIELRAKVAVNQIVPFVFVVLLLFAFALDPDRGFLERATPGLFWVAVLLSSVVLVQRSFAAEVADGGRDALRLTGLDPAGVFLGKAAGCFAVLFALEAVLLVGVGVLYGAHLGGWPVLIVAMVLATAGLVAPGTIYGALSSGLVARETLLPLLFLPVVAPVMIAATRAFEAALDGSLDEGWRWCGLLATFAIVYVALGMTLFEPLLEDS